MGLVGSILFAGTDAGIIQAMRNSSDATAKVQVLHRASVSDGLDLVVAVAFPSGWNPTARNMGYWIHGSRLGIFLQGRGDSGLVYKIALEEARRNEDCFAAVERVTATDVVLACFEEKGREGENRKFVYDIRAKALVKRVDYQRLHAGRMMVRGEAVMLALSSGKSDVVLRYEAGREQPFHIVGGSDGEKWKNRLSPEPRAFAPVSFGLGRFQVALDGEQGPDPHHRKLLVIDRSTRAAKHHRLRQSSYPEFANARPSRVKNGYTQEHSEMNEQIGPWQIAEDTLWFAKTFYDSEGMTGVGGFGFFDTVKREYRTFSPKAIRPFSASAMLVEHDAVWLGLVQRSEWADGPGGLLRFDRQTETIAHVELHEIITGILRVGDALVLATDMGAAVLQRGKLRRFFVDQTTDGRLRVAEGLSIAAPNGMIN